MRSKLQGTLIIVLVAASVCQAGSIQTRSVNCKTVYYNTVRATGSSSTSAQSVYYSARAQDYADLITEAATQYEVEAELVKAVIQTESNFYPYAISHIGACGLMQLMPETAARYGVQSIFDPRDNIQ